MASVWIESYPRIICPVAAGWELAPKTARWRSGCQDFTGPKPSVFQYNSTQVYELGICVFRR